MSQRISSLNQKKLIMKETTKLIAEAPFTHHNTQQMMKTTMNLKFLNTKHITQKNMQKRLLITTLMILKKLLIKMVGDSNITTQILILITSIGDYLNRKLSKKPTKYGVFIL